MVAYTYLSFLLVMSAALGYFVFQAQSERRRIFSIAVAVSGAIAVAGITGIVFLYAALAYPANDDPRFAGKNTIVVSREDFIADQSALQKSGVHLVFPYEVRKGSDFDISLVLSASPAPIAVGSYVSVLTAPKTLELRPQRTGCIPPDGIAACNAISQPKSQIMLSWDVTPTAEAEAQVRLAVPAFWPTGSRWEASLKFDNRTPVYGTGPGCNNRWAGSMDSGCHEVFPIKLNTSSPSFVLTEDTPGTLGGLGWALSYAHARPEIDLEHNQIRFPIRVVTPLGLDADAYAQLALLGTVLSGFLGSGWVWKTLELLKARKGDKSPDSPPQTALPKPASRRKR